MDIQTLQKLDAAQLSDYVWKRLRVEEPLDPPLHHRFRMEPPEEFLISAFQDVTDAGFRQRLRDAISANLKRIALRATSEDFDSVAYQQVASVAFLASAIGNSALAHPLYLLAVAWRSKPGQTDESNLALFHVLRSIARLQNDPSLFPFWEKLWRSVDLGNLRAITYYGLTLADSSRALDLLPEVVADERIDLPVVAWSLATECPGAIRLGIVAAKLPPTLRARLRGALVTAGADDTLLQDFDLRADIEPAPGSFKFEVPAPQDTNVARRRPLLAA